MPNDKLPGQGISAHWDWCSCHFYCHLQHKWAPMPISLSSCWHLPPKGTLGESTSRLTPAEGLHSFQHLQSGAGVPAVRMTDLRGLSWIKQKLEVHCMAHFGLQKVVFFWLIRVLTTCSKNSEYFPQSKCSCYLLAGTSEYSPVSFNILPAWDQKSSQKWFHF